MLLKVLVSSSFLCVMGAPGSDDPFKPLGAETVGDSRKEWERNRVNGQKEQEWADSLTREHAKSDMAISKEDAKEEEDLQGILQGLKNKIKESTDKGELGGVDASAGGIADAIAKGATDDLMPDVGGLDSVSYENDPMHKKDPLKDPNADRVLDALGLTPEEKKALKSERREKTTIDVAIEACYTECHENGCTDHDSPFRCLAHAVKQKAAEISEKCRAKTEKALPYACSVELFVTHCDGIQKPLIPCLDEHHPKLGPECLDVLTVTKKVLKTLKKRRNLDGLKQSESSLLSSILWFGFAVVVLASAWYFYRGGSTKELNLRMNRMLSKAGLKDPKAGFSQGTNDWTSNLETDKDVVSGAVNLNNFGGYGGLS